MAVAGSSEESLAVLLPCFRDYGPDRVIVLPEEVYKRDCKKFPENLAALSIGGNPQIIEGSFKASPAAWEIIKNWIIINEAAIKEQID